MIREDRNATSRKHGARIYQLDDGVVIVKQTVKRGEEKTSPYVVDGDRERHIDPGQDALLAQAVRDALAGKLEPSGRTQAQPDPRVGSPEEAFDAPPGLPLSMLPTVLASLPRLSEQEASDFARDLDDLRADLARFPSEDRWAS